MHSADFKQIRIETNLVFFLISLVFKDQAIVFRTPERVIFGLDECDGPALDVVGLLNILMWLDFYFYKWCFFGLFSSLWDHLWRDNIELLDLWLTHNTQDILDLELPSLYVNEDFLKVELWVRYYEVLREERCLLVHALEADF